MLALRTMYIFLLFQISHGDRRGDRRAWLCASEDVVREIVHHGDAAVDVSAEVMVNLSRNEKASVCRDVAVLE